MDHEHNRKGVSWLSKKHRQKLAASFLGAAPLSDDVTFRLQWLQNILLKHLRCLVRQRRRRLSQIRFDDAVVVALPVGQHQGAMSSRFSTDPWLVDAYRASCTQKGATTDATNERVVPFRTGRLPKRWLEERLLQIPRHLRALSLRLTPQESDAALSPIEMLAMISILFRREHAPNDRPPEIRNLQTALPLAAAMTDKRRRAPFVIPGMQKKAEISCSSPTDRPIPMQSLEIGGPGVTTAVVEELLFRCMELSQDCQLRDLVITYVPEWPTKQGTHPPGGRTVEGIALVMGQCPDVVSCLSLCGPLRRSLRRLVVVNCPSFRITCEYAWALFFGTTPLEHLTLRNTGECMPDVTAHICLSCQAWMCISWRRSARSSATTRPRKIT